MNKTKYNDCNHANKSVTSFGNSLICVWKCFSRLDKNLASALVTKLMAVPFLPNLPERPILWR